MALFKKRLSEKEASAQFVLFLAQGARDVWPYGKQLLSTVFTDSAPIEDDEKAIFNLFLSMMAFQLFNLEHLFSHDQSMRIRQWVFACVTTSPDDKYAVDELNNYFSAAQMGTNAKVFGGNPAFEMLSRSLDKLLGDSRPSSYSQIHFMAMLDIFAHVPVYWKMVKDNYKLSVT